MLKIVEKMVLLKLKKFLRYKNELNMVFCSSFAEGRVEKKSKQEMCLELQLYNKMLADSSGKFQNIITQLIIDKRYEQALEKGLKKYQIRQYKVENLTPKKVVQMYYMLTSKFYSNRGPGSCDSWFQNELRVFIWLVVGYSFIKAIDIIDMKTQDWLFFSQIFNKRNPDLFQFQALTILRREAKCVKWKKEQIQLLDKVINQKCSKNKWNQIARELYIQSQKQFFRTAKQCRQYWINHLDPKALHTGWNPKQDFDLITGVKNYGKKWSQISKNVLNRRTEHMIKNRFKSLLHFETKKHESSPGTGEKEIIEILLARLQHQMINNQITLGKIMKEQIKEYQQCSIVNQQIEILSAEPQDKKKPETHFQFQEKKQDGLQQLIEEPQNDQLSNQNKIMQNPSPARGANFNNDFDFNYSNGQFEFEDCLNEYFYQPYYLGIEK